VLLQEAIISHGCTVKNSNISSAVVGLRSNIEEGCTIDVSRQGEDGGKLRLFFLFLPNINEILFKKYKRLKNTETGELVDAGKPM
jgi:hypothetical protein